MNVIGYTLHWVRADERGSIRMGEFQTRRAAEAAIPATKQELLDQCGEEYQKIEIEDGRWAIEEKVVA